MAWPVCLKVSEAAETIPPRQWALTLLFFEPTDIIRHSALQSQPMPVLCKPKIIGTVSCNSGSIAVVDPTYLETSDNTTVKFPNWNLFTSVDTELGDGEFAVYAQRDGRGRLRRIIIELE